MRFYTQQHQFYCGIGLHARIMYLCIIESEGTVLVHRNMPTLARDYRRSQYPGLSSEPELHAGTIDNLDIAHGVDVFDLLENPNQLSSVYGTCDGVLKNYDYRKFRPSQKDCDLPVAHCFCPSTHPSGRVIRA